VLEVLYHHTKFRFYLTRRQGGQKRSGFLPAALREAHSAVIITGKCGLNIEVLLDFDI